MIKLLNNLIKVINSYYKLKIYKIIIPKTKIKLIDFWIKLIYIILIYTITITNIK